MKQILLPIGIACADPTRNRSFFHATSIQYREIVFGAVAAFIFQSVLIQDAV
jgi:hypothetical protein